MRARPTLKVFPAPDDSGSQVVMDVAGIAELLGCSRKSIYQAISRKQLPFRKRGRRDDSTRTRQITIQKSTDQTVQTVQPSESQQWQGSSSDGFGSLTKIPSRISSKTMSRNDAGLDDMDDMDDISRTLLADDVHSDPLCAHCGSRHSQDVECPEDMEASQP